MATYHFHRAYLPISTKKEPCQYRLTLTPRVQAPQYWYRQEHDIDIYNATADSRNPQRLRKIDAVSRDQRKPVFPYWSAMEDIKQERTEEPYGDEGCGGQDIYTEGTRILSDSEDSDEE